MRKVDFRFEHRRQRDGDGIQVSAVYEFASADWSPWRAVLAWRRKWPALTFDLQPHDSLDAVQFRPAKKVAA